MLTQSENWQADISERKLPRDFLEGTNWNRSHLRRTERGSSNCRAFLVQSLTELTLSATITNCLTYSEAVYGQYHNQQGELTHAIALITRRFRRISRPLVQDRQRVEKHMASSLIASWVLTTSYKVVIRLGAVIVIGWVD